MLSEGVSPDRVVTEILRSDGFLEYAEKILRAEVARQARAITRDKERDVATRLSTARTKKDRATARRELITSTFPLCDGRAVNWLDATAEDHELRAEWLQTHADSTLRTRQLHVDAAAEIRKTKGATCLADLDPELVEKFSEIAA